jgi:HAD superfamily hydrolase (TIGR01450 family)
MQCLDIFRRYDVVLCDIDGVLHTGRDGIEGVPELLREVRSSGPGLFFLTNNGSALPEQISAWLGQLGLEIPAASLVTAGEVLVDAFRDHELQGAAVINLGNEPAAEYVRRAGGVPIPAGEARRRFRDAKAIVVGSTRNLDKDVLDAACNAVRLHDTPVLCTNPDAFAPIHGGEITLVAGGIANLLERELGARVVRLGKPHRPIFDLAMRRVREAHPGAMPRVLVVDDSMDSGIRGGAALGFDTLLVLSGWHRNSEDAESAMKRLGLRPTYILQSLVS